MREQRTTGLLIDYALNVGDGVVFKKLEFDVSLKESHDLRAEVTEYPIEDGMPMADGVRLLPREFTADVFHSTTPFNGSLPSAERDRDMARELGNLLKARVKCTLTTEDGILPNMVLTDVKWDRTVDTGEALLAGLSFKQVMVATRRTTTIPKPVRPITQRGAQQGQLYSEANLVCAPTPNESAEDLPMSNAGGTLDPYTSFGNQTTAERSNATVGNAATKWEFGTSRPRSMSGDAYSFTSPSGRDPFTTPHQLY